MRRLNSFNRYIVECKGRYIFLVMLRLLSFNRYIVECKEISYHFRKRIFLVLIDT